MGVVFCAFWVGLGASLVGSFVRKKSKKVYCACPLMHIQDNLEGKEQNCV